MASLRSLLTEQGHYPSRRTWERRLAAMPDRLPAQIGCLGRYLVVLIGPWAACGRAAAIDSPVLRAKGGVWHKKDREQGVVPHSSIDTEAHWTKSGWHGWVYGWKLHLVTTVAAVWIPLAAALTPANEADNELAPALIAELPEELRMVLGDIHYNAPNVQEACEQRDYWLITPQYGNYPHDDEGKEVRRIFHLSSFGCARTSTERMHPKGVRHQAIENFNEQFKGIFDAHEQVPTKGLVNTQRFALGAILVYQLALLYRFEQTLDLRVGIKAFLKAA